MTRGSVAPPFVPLHVPLPLVLAAEWEAFLDVWAADRRTSWTAWQLCERFGHLSGMPDVLCGDGDRGALIALGKHLLLVAEWLTENQPHRRLEVCPQRGGRATTYRLTDSRDVAR